MAKFHINAEGVPAICRAKKGNCPFGNVVDVNIIQRRDKYGKISY